YLTTIGEVERSSKQKILAKRFEQYMKNSKNEDMCEEISKLLMVVNEVSNPGVKYIQEANTKLNKYLEEIKEILKKDDTIEAFREIFIHLYKMPRTFESYKTIVNYETLLRQTADDIIDMKLISQNLGTDAKKKLTNSLTCLNTLANEIAYDGRISFIRYVLNSSNKMQIIFSNISLTNIEINRHFKELALYFHPDKTGDYNTPISLRDEHKNLGEELFKHILKSKKRLLADLENIIHEEAAHELWKIAIDYRNAAEGKWGQLNVLNQNEINQYSSEELRHLSITNGKVAFETYREACKLADEDDINKQIKLRENMALCLHIAGQSLESQLYALSAIRMLLINCPVSTPQDYTKVKKIFDKVNGNSHTGEAPDKITLDLEKLGQRNPYYVKICYQDSINENIEKRISELMLKPDRGLIRCKSSSSTFIESTLLYCIGMLNPIIPAVIDNWYAATREKLIEIIKEALDANDKGEYQEFINILSKEYKTVQIDGKNANDLKVFAKNVFCGVLSEDLKEDAEKLDNQAIEQTVKIINEIRESISSNYQFVGTSKLRLETLKDFLWVINGRETSEEIFEEFPEESTDSFPSENKDYRYLEYLNEQLKQTSSQSEKVKIYNNIATFFEHLAKKDHKIDKLNSLRNWNRAQNNYERAREIDSQNLDSALGYAKCLLKLSKYTQIIELINTSTVLTLSSEYWCFRSIAYYKQANYEKANECIIEALRLEPKNKLAHEQRLFLKKLMGENSSKRRIIQYEREKKDAKYEQNYFHNSRTSTGGIIAAGLSTPHNKYTDFKPKFSASELLNIYQNRTKQLFTINNEQKSKTKYTNEGRSNLFKEFFGQTQLSHALTELVIPAIDEANSPPEYLFTRNDARSDEFKNDSFVNTLMAATSIPTFFSPYKINNKGSFLDGGMHINNPAEISFTEAIKYKVASEKIFILSLDLYREQLFWASKKFNISNEENAIDRKMYSMLGNQYQRWQVSYEEPIKLDDFERIPYLTEIGHQYLEELDDSDENPIKKLVDYFENKRDNLS
ncbi:9933_t:CDS:2, partial [Racocetra fulgida]